MDCDVLVIGGGIGGATAAVYSARAGKKVILLERSAIGGQLNSIAKIENYPAFETVSGVELAERLERQLKASGVEVLSRDVSGVDFRGDEKKVFTEQGTLGARGVVIATGATAAKLGLKRETELAGDGVSYCSTCDGRFYKGQAVAVVGNTVKAVHDARYLAELCKRVTVVSDGVFEGDLSDLTNVEVLSNAEPIALVGTPLSGLAVRVEGVPLEIPVAGVFVARGFTPTSAPFRGAVEMNERGFIPVDPVTCRTNVPHVYAVGDVVEKSYRQAVTAAGEGATAAHWLLKEIGNAKF